MLGQLLILLNRMMILDTRSRISKVMVDSDETAHLRNILESCLELISFQLFWTLHPTLNKYPGPVDGNKTIGLFLMS